MIKKPAGVTDAELVVLKVLWARGPLTAKAITEVVYPDGAESEFAAVHSFLQRLERKGLVARDRSSFVHVFSSTASQADILEQELKTLAERLGAGSIAPLIMQLIDQKRLSRKEAGEIRKLLAAVEVVVMDKRRLGILSESGVGFDPGIRRFAEVARESDQREVVVPSNWDQ